MNDSSTIIRKLFFALAVIWLFKSYSYVFSFSSKCKASVVAQYLYDQQSYSALSISVASVVVSTILMNLWRMFGSRRNRTFPGAMIIPLIRLFILISTNVITTAISNQTKLSFQSQHFSQDFKLELNCLITTGSIVMMCFQEQFNRIGISGGVSLIVFARTLMPFIRKCSSFVLPSIDSVFYVLTLGFAFYLGVLIECATKRLKPPMIGANSHKDLLILRVKTAGTLPLVVSASLMQFHLYFFDRLSYVSIPLVWSNGICDVSTKLKVLMALLLYGFQTLHLQLMNTVLDCKLLRIKRCIKITKPLILATRENQPGAELFSFLLLFLALLKISYVTLVSLMLKILYFKTDCVLFNYDFTLIVMINFTIATSEAFERCGLVRSSDN